jgi:hypothetical protein
MPPLSIVMQGWVHGKVQLTAKREVTDKLNSRNAEIARIVGADHDVEFRRDTPHVSLEESTLKRRESRAAMESERHRHGVNGELPSPQLRAVVAIELVQVHAPEGDQRDLTVYFKRFHAPHGFGHRTAEANSWMHHRNFRPSQLRPPQPAGASDGELALSKPV